MLGTLTGYLYGSAEDVTNLYKVGQHTVRLLMSVGDLLVGWLLLRQASVALQALGSDGVSSKDEAFYQGKVAVASFFAKTVLPRLTSEKAIIDNADNALMEIEDASF